MMITLYSAKWCPWCQKTKEFLRANDIEFEEKDIDIKEVEEELKDITNQDAVPAVVAGEEFVVGYDEEKLKEVLKI
ncbi:NrdH-redoxin [Candidatus Woesearchaeota archaeon]|nr:NrdH-redoxin [Candidatus Woesearchaeota archaeon]